MTGNGRIGRVVVGVVAVALAVGIGGAAHAAVAATKGTTIVAPYMDMPGDNPAALDNAITSGGLTNYTAAFVLGSSCTPVWDDGETVASATEISQHIATARIEGAEPILSFGGQGGTDLARSCTKQKKIDAAYQSVIDRFHVTRVDFDVEGAALDDSNGNDRRFAAIKTLEADNPDLIVSATLPVGPSGMLDNAVAWLQLAHDDNVKLDLVNIMAMDYGDARDMGATALSSAHGTLAQMQSIWPTVSYSNLGVTAMIGVNEPGLETFTAKNAKTLVKFAKKNGLGRIGFWSINRDTACTGNPVQPDPGCSGVKQKDLAFTKLFATAG